MVLGTILSALPWRSTDNGVEALKAALSEPRSDVDLYGIYNEPRLDTTGANTAIFPVTVYDEESGQELRQVEVEFAIETDVGKRELDDFLGENGIESRENIDAIMGVEADVHRDVFGNTKVQW